MCAHGDECSSYAPGHALHLIQSRLASATPREWVDAIVEHADARTGHLIVRTLDGALLALWNASGAAEAATVGTPVAVHERYHVLAAGRRWFNVSH
ncbi:MAG: hypothetical protein QM602_06375 [Microbacterium sp.]